MAKEAPKPVVMKRVRITGVIRKCLYRGVLFETGGRFRHREFNIPADSKVSEHLIFEEVSPDEDFIS